MQLKLKIYFLQQWFDLSEPVIEELFYERRSLQRFLEVDISNDLVPDEFTVLRFRQSLNFGARGFEPPTT